MKPGDETRLSYRVCRAAVAVIFAAVVLTPVAMVLIRSVWTEAGFGIAAYRAVLAEPRQWTLLGNTLKLAGATALIATLLGAPFGFALEYLRVPGRRLLMLAAAAAFLIPPYITVIAWVDLLGQAGIIAKAVSEMDAFLLRLPKIYSLAGAAMVLALCHYPLIALTTALALRRFDARFEEAGHLVVGRTRTFLSVVLPIVAPGIATGTLIVFLLALVECTVPSLLQVNTYPVEIFTAGSCHDFPAATAHATPLVACGGILFALWALYIRPRQAWLTGATRLRREPDMPKTRFAAATGAWAIIAVSTLIPVAVLLIRSLPMRSFVEVWQTARGEIALSFLVAAGSATALTLLAAAMALFPLRRFYAFGLAPFLISGPLLGLGLIALWNRPGPMGFVYDTACILILACVARFLFFAYYPVACVLDDIRPELDESAAVAGIPWYRRTFGVTLPLLKPTLTAVWGFGFVFALREVDATVLVAPPGPPPLSVRLFSLMHYGPSRLVTALSLLLVVIMLGTAGGAAAVYNRWSRHLS